MVASDEVRISPHKSIYYARMGILTWRMSDCEGLVGVTGDDGAEMLISAFRSRRSISGPEMEV